jgi:hypothetical protein
MINYNLSIDMIVELMDKFVQRFEFSDRERDSLVGNIEKFYEMKHPKDYKEILKAEEELEEIEDSAAAGPLAAYTTPPLEHIEEVSEYSDDEEISPERARKMFASIEEENESEESENSNS